MKIPMPIPRSVAVQCNDNHAVRRRTLLSARLPFRFAGGISCQSSVLFEHLEAPAHELDGRHVVADVLGPERGVEVDTVSVVRRHGCGLSPRCRSVPERTLMGHLQGSADKHPERHEGRQKPKWPGPSGQRDGTDALDHRGAAPYFVSACKRFRLKIVNTAMCRQLVV
jgi:hypothetical protein